MPKANSPDERRRKTDEIIKLVKEGMALERATEEAGISSRQFRRWRGQDAELRVGIRDAQIAGLAPIRRGPNLLASDTDLLSGPVVREELVRMLKTGWRSPEKMAEALGVTAAQMVSTIEGLRDDGYLVESRGNRHRIAKAFIGSLTKTTIDPKKQWGSHMKFGLVSDTHLASKYARLDVLNAAYDEFAKEGITTVYHCGNLVDGHRHRINGNEVWCAGATDQAFYALENYPQRNGIVTEFIWADEHEGWGAKEIGLDWGEYFEMFCIRNGREDLKCRGFLEHDVELELDSKKGKALMRLFHPGGGTCFDDTAKILTRDRGWVLFKELTLDDKVATMARKDHEFQWQHPTHIADEPYDGDMIRFKNRVFNFRVTPNHRLLTRRYRTHRLSLEEKPYPRKARHHFSPDWVVMTAQEIADTYQRQRYEFPTACQGWLGNETEDVEVPRREPRKYASQAPQHVGRQKMEDIAELIGWYVTEGHAAEYSTGIYQSKRHNPENYAQICNLLNRMGLKYALYGEKDIIISGAELSEWLAGECGKGAAKKCVPKWLKNQSKPILQILLDTMLKGDGWKNGESFGYKSISSQLRDDISEIAQKCGYGITTSGDSVQIRAVQNTPALNNKPTVEHYDGRIYCCSVPNGMIYVMVDGKAFWSHNSYAISYHPQMTVERAYPIEDRPDILCMGHFHRAFAFQIQSTWVVGAASTQNQTPYLRKKRLLPDVGFHIIEVRQADNGEITGVVADWRRFTSRPCRTPR